MAEIIEIGDTHIKVGVSGKILSVPVASVHFENPKVGDEVKVYRDKSDVIVMRRATAQNGTRRINKYAYIVVTGVLGFLGIHRFMRGQIGLGVCMLLFGWMTLGIWWLIDFIISVVRLVNYDEQDYVFTAHGQWIE